jgi:hypothetical protein
LAVFGYQSRGRRVLGEILVKAHQALPRPQVQARLKFLAEDPPNLLALDLLQHAPDEEARHQPHQNGEDRHGHAAQEPKEDRFQVDANHGSGPGQETKSRHAGERTQGAGQLPGTHLWSGMTDDQ